MELFKRRITLESLRGKSMGLLYDTIVPSYIYFNIKLSQTMDDMGLVEDVPFVVEGDPCSDFTGGLSIGHITCYDANQYPPNTPPPATGSITAMVSGGYPPYTFEWADGSDSETLTGLLPNIYSVTIKDANDCEFTLEGEVELKTSGDPVLIVRFSQNQFYRILSVNGGRALVPGGGYYILGGMDIMIDTLLTPYNIDTVIICEGNQVTLSTQDQYAAYLWSNGSTAPSITVSESGTYSVTTVTPDGCEGTSTFKVEYISIPDPEYGFNKTPKSGSGTENDPYIFCEDQYPVMICLANNTFFDSWQWMYGPNTLCMTLLQPTLGAVYQYGFTNVGGGGMISSICAPAGIDGSIGFQYPNVHVQFTNNPAICFTEVFEGEDG